LHAGESEDKAQGVIYSIAPSPVLARTVWVGTDNSLVQLTRDDGVTWTNVSPPGIAPWSMISLIDASPHDSATAYVAIDRHQMDDLKPYIYRTTDFGKTWASISKGIPDTAYVHAVREDPVRKGLLFAGTELGVFVSFDDGEMWQPLQTNLPVTPIRDLVIKRNDLVVATHGRSFWILDDISPLRELSARVVAEPVHLFKPATAIRVRKNEGRDTPLQPEIPAGKNPPAGAIIDYNLKSAPTGDVTLQILDNSGHLVRTFSSNDTQRPPDETQAFPSYWLRPPLPLSKHTGLNRFVWDLRYERPLALRYGYGINAAFGEDAIQQPEGPLVLPGLYQVKLTVDDKTFTAPLEVKQDPRVKPAPLALEKQLDLSFKIIASMKESYTIVQKARDLRAQIKEVKAPADNQTLTNAINALDKKLADLVAVDTGFPRTGVVSAATLNSSLSSLLVLVGSSDSGPTAQAVTAYDTYRRMLDEQNARWKDLSEKELPALNTTLKPQNLRL
jgi:hypothetical protein